MTRRGTPIWGAARPMPGAAYIVSTMSSTSVADRRRRSPSPARDGRVQHRVAVLHDGTDRGIAPAMRRSGALRRRARNARQRARVASRWSSSSVSESPPNFSSSASASTQATIASPTTPAAGTTQVSLRSTEAGLRLLGAQVDRAQRHEQGRDRLDHRLRAQLLAVGDAAFEARPRGCCRGAGRARRRTGSRRGSASPGVVAGLRTRRRWPPPSRPGSTSGPGPGGRRAGGPTARTSPRPGGTPRATTSKTPPTRVARLLGRVDLARSSPSPRRRPRSAPGSPRRAPSASQATARGRGARPRRCAATWLRTSTPAVAQQDAWPAPPAATRAVVSRALARSSTLRRSSVRYLSAPARSAWPGRGYLSARRCLASSAAAGPATSRPASSRGPCCGRAALTGLPSVGRGGRRDSTSTASRLDLHAPAAAVAALAAAQVGVDGGAVDGDARGQAVHDHGQRGSVGLAGGQEAQHGSSTLASATEETRSLSAATEAVNTLSRAARVVATARRERPAGRFSGEPHRRRSAGRSQPQR